MHTNEQYGGRRLCASVEIEMDLTRGHTNRSCARMRTVSLTTTILSDAHHLGAFFEAVVQWSITEPPEIQSKQSPFSALFRSENCVSRSLSATAGLIRPLITHYNTTLYSLSADAYQTVSSVSIPDLDQTLNT